MLLSMQSLRPTDSMYTARESLAPRKVVDYPKTFHLRLNFDTIKIQAAQLLLKAKNIVNRQLDPKARRI